MKTIDWKRKLTSRKFWMAVCGFVGPLLAAFGMSEEMSTQVVALIMAGASVVAYIIGEGLTDAAAIGQAEPIENEEGLYTDEEGM